MLARGADPEPMLRQIDYVFAKVLAPSTSPDPTRRLNHLCDRLWLIAAIEHYTAVLGDFALNCAWDDHGADPTLVDVFRWHGSEEVEHRNVAHDVAVYFHDSYLDRIRSMGLAAALMIGFFQRGLWHLCRTDPGLDIGWWRMQRLRAAGLQPGPAPQVPEPVRQRDAELFPARLLTGGGGVHRASRRLSGQLPRRPRRAPVMRRPRLRDLPPCPVGPITPRRAGRVGRPGHHRDVGGGRLGAPARASGAPGLDVAVDRRRPADGRARRERRRVDPGRARSQSAAALASRFAPGHPSAQRAYPAVLAVR